MPFKSVTDLQQRAILTAALAEFCRIAEIWKGTPEYEEAGFFIQSLFNKGATTGEALAAATENALRREEPLFRATESGFQPGSQDDD